MISRSRGDLVVLGSGQDLQARTRLSSIVEEARLSSEAEDWKKAVELYQLKLWPNVPDDDMEAILWLRLQTSHADFMVRNAGRHCGDGRSHE